MVRRLGAACDSQSRTRARTHTHTHTRTHARTHAHTYTHTRVDHAPTTSLIDLQDIHDVQYEQSQEHSVKNALTMELIRKQRL